MSYSKKKYYTLLLTTLEDTAEQAVVILENVRGAEDALHGVWLITQYCTKEDAQAMQRAFDKMKNHYDLCILTYANGSNKNDTQTNIQSSSNHHGQRRHD